MPPQGHLSIPLSEVPGAIEAGIRWLHVSGLQGSDEEKRAEALRLASLFVEDVTAIKTAIERIPLWEKAA